MSLSTFISALEAMVGSAYSGGLDTNWRAGLGLAVSLLGVAAGSYFAFYANHGPKTPSTTEDPLLPEEPPEDIMCPISMNVMQDPVLLCATGQVYDYHNLRKWLTLGSMLCPRTNMLMFDVQVVRMTALKQRCREWNESHGTPTRRDPSPVDQGLQELHADLPDWLTSVRGAGTLDKRGSAAARINDLLVQWTSGGDSVPHTPRNEDLMRLLKKYVIDDLLWLVRYGKNYGKGCAANALSCFTLPHELAWIAVCGAVPLVAMLQSPDAYAQQAAARVINNIVHGSEVVRDILGQAGAVQGLLWQVQSNASAGTNSYTRAPAAQALWGLAHSPRWGAAIIHNAGVQSLKQLIAEGSRYEQRDAAGALLQLGIPAEELAPITRKYLLQLRHCSSEWLHEQEGAQLADVEMDREVAVHQYM